MFGNDFEGLPEVVEEPILAGDGTRCSGGLVLVVILENQAIAVGGERGEIKGGVADGDNHVEALIVGVEVLVERGDERQIAGLGGGVDRFKVEGEAPVGGVGGEEAVGLTLKVGAGGVALEEVRSRGGVGLLDAVVVVYQRKDFGVDAVLGDGAGDLVFLIDGVDAGFVDDGEGGEVAGGVGGEVAFGSDDVEPLGEEEVDLLDVLLERGVAGGVVVDVVGGAQAFSGVERDVGGFGFGLAVGVAHGFQAGFEDRFGRLGEGAVGCGIAR